MSPNTQENTGAVARATSSARGIGEDDHRLLAGAEGEGSTGGMYGPGEGGPREQGMEKRAMHCTHKATTERW